MLEKGKRYEIDIVDMGTSGEGIGRAEGMAVFVPGAVMGDGCEVEITKVKKSFAFGRLTRVIEPSEYRIEPHCAFAGDCGGCSLANMSYEGQLLWKQRKVKDNLERIGGLADPLVEPIVAMEEPLYYRNNGQFPVGGAAEEPAIGFYRARSHEVVDCPDCMLQSEPAVQIAQVIREYMAKYGVTPYDQKTGKGTLRHLVVRNAEGTGEVMVVLVINKGKLPEQEDLADWISEVLSDLDPDPATGVRWKLRCLALNVNQNRGSGSVLGDKTIFLYGQERITDVFEGIQYLISPRSFYQVNTKQAKKLYRTVAEYAELTGQETVFDLYCGVGTISLYLAGQAKRVMGIEVVKDAILDANRNAIKNEIVNAVFTCGKAEEALPAMVSKGTRAHVAVVDPPRNGCDPATLQAIADAGVERIVYVSCNPATLARDVKSLSEMGYEFFKARPVDMFPWTAHIETVCLLSNRKPDTKVRIDVDLEDYYRIKDSKKNQN